MILESERIKVVKESEDTFALVIERVTIQDSGSYSVVASNALGQMSDFWQMVANAPPAFLKELLKTSQVDEGEAITFQVQVEGNPMPSVKWSVFFRFGRPFLLIDLTANNVPPFFKRCQRRVKDGKELVHDGKSISIKEDGSIHSLSVSGVKRSDTGKYSCVITNPHGAKEDSSELKVRCQPEIKQSLKDVEAKEGDKDVAFVLKADGYPEPKIKWFIDEVEITEERKEFSRTRDPVAGTYSLVLKEIRSDLSGKYTVQLSNELGSVKSSAVLSVQYPPKLEEALKETRVEEGKSATLKVKCSGLPEPTAKWFKDGVDVTAGSDARIEMGKKKEAGTWSLTVDKCTALDQGSYAVQLTNALGDVTSNCALFVDCKFFDPFSILFSSCRQSKFLLDVFCFSNAAKPKILSDNVSAKEVYEEEEIVYEVRVSGQPKPQATWYVVLSPFVLTSDDNTK